MAESCAQCKEKRERLYWNSNPCNKHHFVKILVDFKNNLRIPRKFIDEFQGELSETVTLRGPSGDSWETTLANSGRDFILRDGWTQFVQDHSLNKGDILVFRHIKDSEFNVLIFDTSCCEKEASHFVKKHGKFPADGCCSLHQVKKLKLGKEVMHEDDNDEEEEEKETSDSNDIEQGNSGTSAKTEKVTRQYSMYYESSRRAITEKDKKKAFDKASKFQSKNASCKVTMKPSHVHHLFVLTVPKDFADNCLPKTSQAIKLRSNSKTWQVNLKRRNVQCTLNKGWAEFVLDNTLETDDICVFELARSGTSKAPAILDVHIFRAVEKTIPLKVVKPYQMQ